MRFTNKKNISTRNFNFKFGLMIKKIYFFKETYFNSKNNFHQRLFEERPTKKWIPGKNNN